MVLSSSSPKCTLCGLCTQFGSVSCFSPLQLTIPVAPSPHEHPTLLQPPKPTQAVGGEILQGSTGATGASSWSCERASCRAAAECPGTNMPQSQSQPASHHAVHKRLPQHRFGSQEWLSLEPVAGVWCRRSGAALWQGFCSVQTQQERSQLCHQLLPASTSQNCCWGAWGGVGTAPCTFPSCAPS